ncbi:MAG: hypothetical protein ACEPOV_13605 [Hyphomicrobiales bacterium]
MKHFMFLTIGMILMIHSNCALSQTHYNKHQLPDCIYTFTSIDNEYYYALGMSDHQTDKTKAFLQAKYRAYSLLSLTKGFNYSKMFEQYRLQKQSDYNSKNAALLQINSGLDTNAILIEECHFTKEGVCFLLLKQKKKQQDTLHYNLNNKASLFYSGGKNNNIDKYGLLKMNLYDSSQIPILRYKKYYLESSEEILSYTLDHKTTHKTSFLKYSDFNTEEIQNCPPYYSKAIKNSFWDTYISLIFESISNYYNEKAITSAFSDLSTKKKQIFDRFIFDGNFSINLNTIAIRNDSLFIQALIQEQKQ